MKKTENWTKEEDIFLEHYWSRQFEWLCRRINRSGNSIYNRAIKLGLPTNMKITYVRNMTNEEQSYIAGIFDGDGSIGLYENKKQKTYHLYLSIITTVKDYAVQLREITGLGCYSTDYHKRKGISKRTQHRLTAHSKRAIKEFTKQIIPFSRLKKPQLEITIKWINGEISDERADTTLKKLKKLG